MSVFRSGGVLVGAMQGASKEELLRPMFSAVEGLWNEDPLCPEIEEIAQGSFKEKNPPEIRGSGYVVESLEAALWAFYKGEDFREAILLATNLGNDADTTAAICGQLAGAHYGLDGIPKGWLENLALRQEIMELTSRLTAS